MESQQEAMQSIDLDEILFENVYTPTKEMFQEYIKYATRKSYKIVIYTAAQYRHYFRFRLF